MLRLWRSPVLPSLALLLVSLAVALREGLRATGGRLVYALDDAYIHMAVGRTFAEHGVWGCTPFHFSSSSSSPLWTFGLGVAYALTGVRDWTPLLLNVALAILTLVVAEAFLARLGTPPLVRSAALVGVVLAFPMSGMALMGMEHILHLLLTIAFAAVGIEALVAGEESPQTRRRATAALFLLGALLGASRYEGFFLIGLVCLGLLVRRQPARAVSIGVASLLPVVVLGAVSVANGWYFLPNPLMVKAVGEGTSTLSRLLRPFGSEDLAFLRNNRAMPILLAAGLLAAAAHGRGRTGFWRPLLLLPLLLAAMILLHGHFVFSPMYWAYRYDAYLVAFGILVLAATIAGLRSPALLPRGAAPTALVLLLVPAVADVREGLFPAAEVEGMRGTYLEQFQTAEFLRRYYSDATVIVNDLGAVTYYTRARILDLVGLGDLEPVAMMRRGAYTSREVVEWTAPYQPRIAIVSLGWSVARPLVPREWVRVAVVEAPPHRHRVGFYAVDPAESWTLRAAVSQHYGPLVQTMGHGLRLRRPEDMPASPPHAGMPPRGEPSSRSR